jgi:DNA-binding GntR family transcriptional regulator
MLSIIKSPVGEMASNRQRPAAVEATPSLVRRSSGEHVALYIRQLIFNGALRPGQRVPQDDITRALGVSRIPVRESLIALEREGWVTIENYRGAFVNAFSPETIEDQYDLLGLIYDFAIHRAMDRSGEEFIEKISALSSDLAETTDRAKAVEHIYSFYQMIGDYAQSSRLQVILRAISGLIPGDFFEAVPVAIDVERRSIAKVVRALRRGATDRAVAELRKGLDETSKEVTRLYRDQGLFERPHDADWLGA